MTYEVKMDYEIDELKEYSLFSEFLDVATEAIFSSADDLDEFNVSDESDQEWDFEEIEDVAIEEPLEDEFDDTEADIIQCIVNMIQIEHILQNDSLKERRKGERRWGVHPLNQMRREQGHFHHLFEEMLAHDHDEFFNYTRMTPERFDHLFKLIETKITKEASNAIPAKCRLLITLR